jgi:hypothetical protein
VIEPRRGVQAVDQGMVELVQASVLRLVDRTSTVDPDVVWSECPGADLRDLERAVQLLVQEDMILVPATGTEVTGTIVGVRLTEDGRARLAAD